MLRFLFVLITVHFAMGCQTTANTEIASAQDYKSLTDSLEAGLPQDALADFHGKESGEFITVLEKGWLQLLAGKPSVDELRRIGDDLESRKVKSISRETTKFFYKETTEGYFPAEHEVVALHIIAGFNYLKMQNIDSAKVEARRAAFYLQGEFDDTKSQAHFDDPTLRLWLASLWIALGEWEKARVDLRVAAKLNKNPELARLANATQPPQHFNLYLSGAGADAKIISAGTSMMFIPLDGPRLEENIFIDDKVALVGPFNSINWYTRHLDRDSLLASISRNARFATDTAGAMTMATAASVVGGSLGVIVISAGIAGSIAVAYLIFTSDLGSLESMGEGAAAVIGVAIAAPAVAGLTIGMKIFEGTGKVSKDILDKVDSPSDFYRYVRFLPTQIYFSTVESNTPPAKSGIKNVVSHENGKTKFNMWFASQPQQKSAIQTRSSYKDAATKLVYSLYPRALSYAEAVKTCAKVPGSRLPTWAELQDVKKRIMSPLHNPIFYRKMRRIPSVWIESASHKQDKCRTLFTEDFSESPQIECSNVSHALCVSGE